ncbi:MAG: NUDIX hydrolase [Methylococcales bacterium]|nr:NUDIX hydrolase [Methylococcales bacterium]
MKSLLDGLYRMLYRCAYPIMQCYWQLFKQATHGAQVAVWVDNNVLLIRNSYRPEYGFPGGHINSNETAIQAAVRELQEETGIVVTPEQLQQTEYITYSRNGIICSDTLFKCQLNSTPKVTIDNREVIENRFTNLTESKQLLLQNAVKEHLSAVKNSASTTQNQYLY